MAAAIYLGEISYSLYLVHAFVLSILYNAFKIPRIAAFVPVALRDWLVIIVALVAASALYHLVEKPGRKIIRALRRPQAKFKAAGGRFLDAGRFICWLV